MRIATWNLNNRVGKVRFKPEAALAAAEIGADVLVLTEYHPRSAHEQFVADLRAAGYSHALIAPDSDELVNRVLVASRLPIADAGIARPSFDTHFGANLTAFQIPSVGLKVIGVRVPAYPSEGRENLRKGWEWLARAAADCCGEPSVILGDLNVSVGKRPTGGRSGPRFPENFGSEWHRHQPRGSASYFGHGGARTQIDHLLTTSHCRVSDIHYLTRTRSFTLADGRGALSDHAALVADISVR